jgi:DnaJ-domain-containing protein 1
LRGGSGMRAQQSAFDFDVFDMAGFTAQTINSREQAERDARRAERERKARQEREREEQARRERRARSRHSAYESPWDVLGVMPGASGAEIKSAWRRLCRKHHPDVGGDVAEMQRVNRAYESLKGQMR